MQRKAEFRSTSSEPLSSAQALGCSPGTYRVRLHRARRRLAKQLEAAGRSSRESRATIDAAELRRAMRRAMLAGDTPARPIPVGDRAAMERGAGGGAGLAGIFSRHRAASVGFGLACVAVIAVLIILGGGSVDSVKDGSRPTYAAAAVKVAEANPRLLVTAPGWSIIHANSFQAEYGGLTYREAGHPAYGPEASGLVMSWAPAALYRSTLRESRRKATVKTSTVLGRRATTFHYRGRPASAYRLRGMRLRRASSAAGSAVDRIQPPAGPTASTK